MFNLYTLLEAGTAAAGTATAAGTAPVGGFAEMIPSLIIMVAMVVGMYFLMIRPQNKKDKAIKEMLNNLKVSDRICTIGGIYGTIVGLKEDTVTICVGAQKTTLVLARWAIRSVEDAPLENDSEALV